MEFRCTDGYVLHGHLWTVPRGDAATRGTVVVAGATGVKASYYHRYAAFLAENGFTAITFDYRGIGQSRHSSLKKFAMRWYDWGLKDMDAVLGWALDNSTDSPVHVVGHSFGGFGVGLAANGSLVTRVLSVGAQHAYWKDYRRGHRLRFWFQWHLLMPSLALWTGYFPGKKLGWLEDLPQGVALDWARSRKDFTAAGNPADRAAMRAHQAAFTAPTIAVATTDDPYATEDAVARMVSYHPNSTFHTVRLKPEDLGETEIGHFALFNSRFRDTFWRDGLRWLRDGENPWPDADSPDGPRQVP